MPKVNSVRDIDRGYRALMRRLHDVGGEVVAVGIAEGPENPDAVDAGTPKTESEGGLLEVTVAAIASVHEFGLGHVPERSFIRGWFDENETAIREFVRKVSRAVLVGKMTEDRALQLMGVEFQGQIQARISRGIEPELDDATIDRKGSSKQLIDTGQLRQAISWKVLAA